VLPGYHCSVVCLAAACMMALGVDHAEIHHWLADVVSARSTAPG
jgi:hypothetical protein